VNRGRPAFAVLAALALLIQVLVPQGFMISAAPGGAGLVICTGHGPLTLADRHAPAKAPKRGSDAPCVFAGLGLASAPPPAPPVAAPALAYEAPAAALPPSLSPGRGLAAPPPPSRGPPLRSV
jgi:hypothetical protein